MLTHVVEQRRLRIDGMSGRLSSVMWRVILVGAAISIGVGYLLNIQDAKLHAALIVLLAGILGIAVLLVDGLPVPRIPSTRLAFVVAWKTLLFGTVTPVFRLPEEFVSLLSKSHSVMSAAAATYGETPWRQFAVMTLWVFGGLFFYCLSCELVRIVGAGKVRKLLFERSGDTAAG